MSMTDEHITIPKVVWSLKGIFPTNKQAQPRRAIGISVGKLLKAKKLVVDVPPLKKTFVVDTKSFIQTATQQQLHNTIKGNEILYRYTDELEREMINDPALQETTEKE